MLLRQTSLSGWGSIPLTPLAVAIQPCSCTLRVWQCTLRHDNLHTTPRKCPGLTTPH